MLQLPPASCRNEAPKGEKTCHVILASQTLPERETSFEQYVHIQNTIIPVVPHEALAEVSRIGNV